MAARRRAARGVGLLLTATLALSACSGSAEPRKAGELSGSTLTNNYVVPDVTLTDTDSAAYSVTDDTDKPVTLVFFGFTNCPDICGFVMANIAGAMTRLSAEQREQVEVVFVTTDPARDDEAALREYLDRYDPSFTGLTGELDTIVGLGEAFHVYMKKEPKLPSGGYNVSHTTHFFYVDDNDEVPVLWSADTSAAELAADLTELLDRRSDS